MKLVRAIAVCWFFCATAQMGNSAAADDYLPPKVDTTTPTGVNLADGSFIYSQTDISIGTLSLERHHLGGIEDPNAPFFGPRMSNNFDVFITTNYQPAPHYYVYSPIVHTGLSAAGPYQEHVASGVSTITPEYGDGNSGVLAKSGSAYVYTAQDGTIYTFNPSVSVRGAISTGPTQRVASIAYPNGRLLSFSYDANGDLKEVTDSNGFALIFDYTADHTVSAACGFNLSQTYVTVASTCTGASLKVVYGYTSGLLTSVTDVLGNTTTYQYQGQEISCILPPGMSTCKIRNDYGVGGWFQVNKQTLADGSVWQFSYWGQYTDSRDPNPTSPFDGDYATTVTDPASKVSHYIFTQTSPNSVTDANSRTTTYKYSGGGTDPNIGTLLNEGSMLVEADYPEGNKYKAEFFGPFNALSKQTWAAKPGSGLPDAVATFGYSCSSSVSTPTCAKPINKVDPKGNQTDYTYATFGGVTSEMQPAPSSGAARPLKLYSYVQKSAYVKNSGGSLVSTGVPIWVISTMTQCQTVAGSSTAACDTAAGAPRLQTTYQYSSAVTANNLLARGVEVKDLVTSATRLTCYTYDPIGRKISETSPRGNASITVCP